MLLQTAVARFRALFRQDVTTDEIREELQFHVDMRTDEYVRQGLDGEAARQAARRKFGNVAVIQDRGYDIRGGGMLETVLQDLKYALRQLARRPLFTLLSLFIIAVGMGLSTALFSVIDAALLRPLPYQHPEQLVSINVEELRGSDLPRYSPSMEDIRAWRSLTTIVSHAGMGRVSGFVPLIVDAGTPQRLTVAEASEDFLETYGIVPVLGRGIRIDDTREGAPAVALLGHAYWTSQFGGEPTVLGQTIRIEDEPSTIVGILPAGFYADTAVWQAKRISRMMASRRGSGTPVVARLQPGVTLAHAQTAFDGVTSPGSISSAIPAPAHVVMESMYRDETSGYGNTIRTLAVAVALIMLIGSTNVAGLLLVRGATRHVELSIRAAIGAGQGRLLRQLMTESALLALIGTLAGVLFAYAALDALVGLVPLSLPATRRSR